MLSLIRSAMCTVDVINCTWGSLRLCFLSIGIDEVVTRSTPTGRSSAIGVNSET